MPPGTFLVQKGVTWITPADVVWDTYQSATVARMRANDTEMWVEGGSNAANWIPFNFPIPVALGEIPVKITEITIYYNTTLAAAYIDWVQLRKLNPATGGFTKPLDFTADLGNGSTGNASAVILSTPLALDDAPYQIVLKQAGVSDYGQVKIYGLRVVWEATG